MFNPYLKNLRPYPLKLIVDIHSYCNARCTMCPYPKYARKQTQGTMAWSVYTAIVDEFTQMGKDHDFCPAMTYCYMAEPFLADDLAKYVRYAVEQNVQVYLNTNAMAMTHEKIDALLETGFDGIINISMHGITARTHERITGLNYQQCLDNTLYLIDHYTPKNILIRGVDDNWPADEPADWLDYWKPKGVQLEYLPPISRCGSVRRLFNRSNKSTIRLYGCQYNHPLVEMVILHDGHAVMCCQDMGRELLWGDVAQSSIAEVWNGKIRLAAVKKLYSGRPSGRSFLCARCEQALTSTGLIKSLAHSTWRKFFPGK
ncbi:MAG: radical SAM protein [Phycisphaerae bacterium]|nr:radical SAM protein [Phycisphaerae bacterium]